MHTQTRTGKTKEEGSTMHTQHSHTHSSARYQSRPGSLRLASATSTTAAPPLPRPPLDGMTPGEASAWLGSMRERLEKMMMRERANLSRRAARGTHTPTDDAYEEDQFLEVELIDLLNEVTQHV